MTDTISNKLTNAIEGWSAPDIGPDIPHGDMPGDKIVINAAHIEKARIIFPRLLPLLKMLWSRMALHAPWRPYAAVLGSANLKRLHCWRIICSRSAWAAMYCPATTIPGVFPPKMMQNVCASIVAAVSAAC